VCPLFIFGALCHPLTSCHGSKFGRVVKHGCSWGEGGEGPRRAISTRILRNTRWGQGPELGTRSALNHCKLSSKFYLEASACFRFCLWPLLGAKANNMESKRKASEGEFLVFLDDTFLPEKAGKRLNSLVILERIWGLFAVKRLLFFFLFFFLFFLFVLKSFLIYRALFLESNGVNEKSPRIQWVSMLWKKWPILFLVWLSPNRALSCLFWWFFCGPQLPLRPSILSARPERREGGAKPTKWRAWKENFPSVARLAGGFLAVFSIGKPPFIFLYFVP